MHILISLVLAFIVAWAFRKRGKPDPLGWWRVGACVTAALLPHTDNLFYFIGSSFGFIYQYTFMWSLVLAPLFAFGIAQAFSAISGGNQPESRRNWQRYFVPVLATMIFNLLLALMSENGIALLAPLWFGRFSLSILHSFDVGLLIGMVVFALLAFFVGAFKTDIARATLMLLLVYMGIVGTFKLKAYNVGERYADSMGLQVENVYTLPQPLSPFYWRIVVETEDGRLHDTRISLKRSNPIPITPDMNLVQRAKASYMPIHAAIWRIYNRYGLDNPEFVRLAWQSDISKTLGWASHFAVYQKMRTHKGMQCAQMKDIRFSGIKSGHLGRYLLCRDSDDTDNGWKAYQAAEDASFFRLEAIY